MTGLCNLPPYKMKRGRSLSLLSVLWSVIIILQTGFLGSTTVLASPRVSMAAPTLGASRAVDFTDVSVVRLVATYEPPAGQAVKPTSATLAQCTGLGVMISSWTSTSGNDQNNWLLTDGNLINPDRPSCSPTSASSNLTLLRVDLYFNTVFNPALLPAFQVPPNSVRCQLPTCSGGLALLSFATSSNQTFPHVDLANSTQTQNIALGLSLQNESKPLVSLPAPSNTNAQLRDQYVKEAQRYLTPQQEKPADAKNPLEAGSPIFNQAGELTAIELSNKTSVPVSGLAPMINALPVGKFSSLQRANAIESVPTLTPSTPSAILPVHNNAVYENWKTGIKSFYQGDYVAARVEFQKAEQGNALFETPLAFEQLINSRLIKIASNPTPPSSSITIKIFGVQLTKNLLIVLILSVLAILLALMCTLLLRARFLHRRRVLYAEAERQANAEAQRIKAVEGAQGQQHQWVPSSVAPAFSTGRIKTSPLSLAASVPCPNCGAAVKPDANFCSNCRMMLSPVGPAHHIRAMEPPMPPAQQAMPFTMPVVNSKSDVPVVPIQPPPVGNPPASIPSPTLSISTWPVSDKPDGDSHPSKSFDNSVKEKAPHVANTGATPYIDQRLGNYRIKSLLGRGGFADVYLGEHVFLKTNAAVKVLHTRLTSGDLAKFLTEARTIASLSHPHIIRVLDFGLEGNEPDMDQSSFDMEGSIPFLIMDYAPGGTLRGRYPKGTRVPLSEIIHYVKQVAEALQYAHDRKLIHRDVKPENMLLSQNDELLLSDFGIVAVAHDDHSMSTQEMAGTVSYIAPEQIKGKPRPASDQYALAVVVYEWLSGIRPFQGNSQWEIMNQHLSFSPIPLCARISSLPPAVDNVVLKALEKNPSQRFETISAFADALEQAAK